MNIEKRRAEIAARKAEIRKLLTDDKNGRTRKKRQAIERMLNSSSAMGNPIENPLARPQPDHGDTEKLYRSAWLETLQGRTTRTMKARLRTARVFNFALQIPRAAHRQKRPRRSDHQKNVRESLILQRCKIFHVGGFKNSPSKS